MNVVKFEKVQERCLSLNKFSSWKAQGEDAYSASVLYNGKPFITQSPWLYTKNGIQVLYNQKVLNAVLDTPNTLSNDKNLQQLENFILFLEKIKNEIFKQFRNTFQKETGNVLGQDVDVNELFKLDQFVDKYTMKLKIFDNSTKIFNSDKPPKVIDRIGKNTIIRNIFQIQKVHYINNKIHFTLIAKQIQVKENDVDIIVKTEGIENMDVKEKGRFEESTEFFTLDEMKGANQSSIASGNSRCGRKRYREEDDYDDVF